MLQRHDMWFKFILLEQERLCDVFCTSYWITSDCVVYVHSKHRFDATSSVCNDPHIMRSDTSGIGIGIYVKKVCVVLNFGSLIHRNCLLAVLFGIKYFAISRPIIIGESSSII